MLENNPVDDSTPTDVDPTAAATEGSPDTAIPTDEAGDPPAAPARKAAAKRAPAKKAAAKKATVRKSAGKKAVAADEPLAVEAAASADAVTFVLL